LRWSVSTVVCPACLCGVATGHDEFRKRDSNRLSGLKAPMPFVGVSWLLVDFVSHHHINRLASLGRVIRSDGRLPVFLSFGENGPDNPD
jgi:hypothetical protein